MSSGMSQIPAALSVLLTLAQPAMADRLLCLGTGPGFMLDLDGATARLDYLGDGIFPLSPDLSLPRDAVARFEIGTHGGPVPVFVEPAECRILGATLAFRVEIGIETSRSGQPMTGCCREAD
jgi:hypothetical protein